MLSLGCRRDVRSAAQRSLLLAIVNGNPFLIQLGIGYLIIMNQDRCQEKNAGPAVLDF